MIKKEVPICSKCKKKMVYSQYSHYWYCAYCVMKKEEGVENYGKL